MATYIEDTDGDTKVQTEEISNEDRIRFDTAGTERMIVDLYGLSVDSINEKTLGNGVTVANVTLKSGYVSQPSQSRARAYRAGTNQGISDQTFTKVQLNGESFDNRSEFDAGTNYRFTPSVEGYYLVSAMVAYWTTVADKAAVALIYKNGSEYSRSSAHSTNGNYGVSTAISDIVYLNGSGDYVELYTWHNFGASRDIPCGSNYCFMSVAKIG